MKLCRYNFRISPIENYIYTMLQPPIFIVIIISIIIDTEMDESRFFFLSQDKS